MLARSCLSMDIDFTPMLGRRQRKKILSSQRGGGGGGKSLLHYEEEDWRENKLPSEGNIHGN